MGTAVSGVDATGSTAVGGVITTGSPAEGTVSAVGAVTMVGDDDGGESIGASGAEQKQVNFGLKMRLDLISCPKIAPIW